MKKIFFSFWILLPMVTFCQPWLLKYDLPDWKSQETWSFNHDYDHGYLLTLNVANFTPYHNQHGLIQKIDDNGNLQYELLLGDNYNDYSFSSNISVRTHGMQLIVGSHWDHTFSEKPMILVLDSCNQKSWCTLLDNCPHNSYFVDGLMLPDSSIVAVSLYNDIDYNRPIFIHKFNKYGEQLWKKELASMDLHPDIWNPDIFELIQLSDGNFLVTGLCYWPNPIPNSPQYVRMFLVKADPDGNEIDFYVHGINDQIYSYAQLSVEQNGKIYTGGAQYPVSGGDSTPHLFVNDIDCDPINDIEVNIPDVGQRSARYQVILTPYSGSAFFGVIEMGLPDLDAEGVPAVIKLDTSGLVSDFYMHPDTTLSSYVFPDLTLDNKVLLAGGYGAPTAFYKFLYQMRLLTDTLRLDSIPWSNYNYDTLCPDSVISQIIPIDSCLIVVHNTSFKPPLRLNLLEMLPYPVPTDGQLIIKHSNSLQFRDITITFYNTLGTLIETITVNSGTDASKIDAAYWSSGLYVAVATSRGSMIGSCKFIKQ